MGSSNIDLQTARQLAVGAGFVFEGDDTQCSIAQRANLAALFEHCGVNTLSSFKHKFKTADDFLEFAKHRMSSPAVTSASSQQGPSLTKGQQELTSSSGRTTWAEIRGPREERYWGTLQRNQRHGLGILLFQAGKSVAKYEGEFVDGQREGLGVVTTATGEMYWGPFKANLMFGPGVFKFARKAGREPGAAAERVEYTGMFNGMPRGKGMYTMADDTEELGEYEGVRRVKPLGEEECKGILLVARRNAAEALKVQQQVQIHVEEQGLQIGD